MGWEAAQFHFPWGPWVGEHSKEDMDFAARDAFQRKNGEM